MKPKLLIRIAAGCVLFFALGHSMGHFTRKNTTDQKQLEVLQVMSDNKFDIFGQLRSYDEMYTGMSLNLILTLLTFTFILWIASGIASSNSKICQQILQPIFLCTVGFAITGFLFFFLLPAVTCVVASILIFYSIILLRKQNV